MHLSNLEYHAICIFFFFFTQIHFFIGLQLLSLLKNDDTVCEYKKTSCFPLICIFNMNLPRSRWPFAKEYECSSHIHHRWHYLGPSEFLPAKLPSQSRQKACPSSQSGRHKGQTPQSSQVVTNIHSGILAEDLSKRLCMIGMSNRGHHVFAVLSGLVEKHCMFVLPRSKNRGSDFQDSRIVFEQNAPP